MEEKMAKVPGSIRDEVFETGCFKRNRKGYDAIKMLSQKGFLNVLKEDKGIFYSTFIVFQPDLLEEWAREVYVKLRDAGVKRYMIKIASFWFNSGSTLTEPDAKSLADKIEKAYAGYENIEVSIFRTHLRENVDGYEFVATSGYGINGRIVSDSYRSAQKIHESIERILKSKESVSEIDIDF